MQDPGLSSGSPVAPARDRDQQVLLMDLAKPRPLRPFQVTIWITQQSRSVFQGASDYARRNDHRRNLPWSYSIKVGDNRSWVRIPNKTWGASTAPLVLGTLSESSEFGD